MATNEDRYSQADHDMAAKMEEMFKDNGWKPIDLTHPQDNDLRLYVEPYYYGDGSPSKASDVEYFSIDCNRTNLYGSENLLEIAKTFNDLPEIVAQEDKSKDDFHKFYEDKIAGYSDREWTLSNRVAHMAYEGWTDSRSEDSKMSYPDYLNKHMPDIAVRLQLPLEVANDAMMLSENASMYSDWSKDLYGHRFRDRGEVAPGQEGKLFGGLHESEYDAAFAKEHPEIELRPREEVYEEADRLMNQEEVRNVPNHLVSFEERSGANYAVIRTPDAGWGYDDELDPAHVNDSITLPSNLVKQNEDGTYNLMLDRRETYAVENPDSFDSRSVSPGELHNRMSAYRVFCERKGIDITGPVASAEVQSEPVAPEKDPVMISTAKNGVQFFNKGDKDWAAVSVPHASSPYGSGKIYVPAEDVKLNERGTSYNVSLKEDSYTVNYNAKDENGNKIRVHDKGISANELKSRVDERTKSNIKLRVKSLEGIQAGDSAAELSSEPDVK